MQNLRSDPRQFSNLVMVDIYLFQIIIKKLNYWNSKMKLVLQNETRLSQSI